MGKLNTKCFILEYKCAIFKLTTSGFDIEFWKKEIWNLDPKFWISQAK